MIKETITLDAVKQNMDSLTEQIETLLSQVDCPMADVSKILVCVDEIFNNICSYAYSDGKNGKADIIIQASAEDKKMSLSFKDHGIPYNPLEHEDPDTTLSADERPIGGLGIFLVKKMMNNVNYQFIDEENVLTIEKSW